MRIIDKNTDFYDYMQDSTDTLVFDRRGSWLLTKETLCSMYMSSSIWNRDKSKYRFMLLQCGATFWLLLITATERDGTLIKNYELSQLATWKDYDAQLNLINIDIIEFHMAYKLGLIKDGDYDIDLCKKNMDKLVSAIKHKEFRTNIRGINSYDSVKDKYEVPLLKATGIGNVVNNTEIFCAIEEYFSLKKTASETTEPKGGTNDDKITMHGFDLKSSFRGKR